MKEIIRSFFERRSWSNRRNFFSIKRLLFSGKNRRNYGERRSDNERRENWVRICKWSSVPLNQLKISKYILGKTSLFKNNPY